VTFAVSDPCTLLYAYGAGAVADLDIRYAYLDSPMVINDLDVVTSYGTEEDRWERQLADWAWSTQEIGNRFPRWHAARLNTGGDTQMVINGWGVNYDQMLAEYARARRNVFIDTVEPEQPSVFRHASPLNYSGVPEKQRVTNILLNSNFSVKALARRDIPMWWSSGLVETSGTITMPTELTFYSSHSVRMHCEIGERCYLRQSVQPPTPKGETLTASIWYIVPIPKGYADSDENRMALSLSVMYVNGSMEIVKAPLSIGTGGNWQRVAASLLLTNEVFNVTLTVEIINDNGAEPVAVYLGAAQLERSDVVTPWEQSDALVVPHVNEEIVIHSPFDAYIDEGEATISEEVVSGQPVTVTGRKWRRLTYLDDYWQLWYDAMPTRATSTLQLSTPPATQRGQLGWYANPEKERYSTSWRITGNQIEQYNASIPVETLCLFDIGEMHLDEDGRLMVGIDAAVTRTLEAICVYKNKLWVLCLEVEGGVTRRVLKILNPHSRWPIPLAHDQSLTDLHLECLGDVDVGYSTGAATYLGVVDANPDQFLMLVGGSDAPYLIDLEYDYFTVDRRRAEVIVRNDYSGTLVTV